jgi:hypothetical protein
MYHVTIHHGSTAESEDTADVLFVSNVESAAWLYYSSVQPDRGTTLALLWNPDETLIASRSGPRVLN